MISDAVKELERKIAQKKLLAGVIGLGYVGLESTTYPGTTVEVLLPILEQSGLIAGRDFILAFSPEREDPGNPHFGTASIPKVVGGTDEYFSQLIQQPLSWQQEWLQW